MNQFANGRCSFDHLVYIFPSGKEIIDLLIKYGANVRQIWNTNNSWKNRPKRNEKKYYWILHVQIILGEWNRLKWCHIVAKRWIFEKNSERIPRGFCATANIAENSCKFLRDKNLNGTKAKQIKLGAFASTYRALRIRFLFPKSFKISRSNLQSYF